MNKYDAILVLGTSTDKELYKHRVERAVNLYIEGKSDKVIFSGRFWGGLKIKPKQTEAFLMSKYAKSLGLPSNAIFTEERSLNTIGNFYFTKKYLLRPSRLRNLLVITHDAHLEKVKYLAKKILGRSYKCKFALDGKESRVTHKGVGDIKRFFLNIANGEDKKISQLMKNHPYYTRYRNI